MTPAALAVTAALGLGACAAEAPQMLPGCDSCDEGVDLRLVSGADVAWVACHLEPTDDGFGIAQELSCDLDPRTVNVDGAWAELDAISVTLAYANGEISDALWLRGSEARTMVVGRFFDYGTSAQQPFPGTLTVVVSSPGGESFSQAFTIEDDLAPAVTFHQPFDVWEATFTASAADVRHLVPSTEFAFAAPEGVTYERAYAEAAMIPSAARMGAEGPYALRVPEGFGDAVPVTAKVYVRDVGTVELSVDVTGPGVYDVMPAATPTESDGTDTGDAGPGDAGSGDTEPADAGPV